MADEPTPAGDDQQTPDKSQENAGEGQQGATSAPDPRDERIAKLEEELENTNAFVKTQFNQRQQEPEEEDAPVDLAGVPQETIKALRAATGADKLEKELAALRKEREDEKLQAQQRDFTSKVEALEKEFPPSEGYPKPNAKELLEHGQRVGTINPRLAYMDKYGAVIEDKRKAVSKEAPKSDRSDSPKQTKLSRAEYLKQLEDIAINNPSKIDEFELKHGTVIPE